MVHRAMQFAGPAAKPMVLPYWAKPIVTGLCLTDRWQKLIRVLRPRSLFAGGLMASSTADTLQQNAEGRTCLPSHHLEGNTRPANCRFQGGACRGLASSSMPKRELAAHSFLGSHYVPNHPGDVGVLEGAVAADELRSVSINAPEARPEPVWLRR
jgi:hypothetical protein